MTAVAIVGADGAGKSTVARRLAELLSFPARVVYMGVNLEHSALMLPTTRVALELKRARGGRPDLAGPGQPRLGTASGPATSPGRVRQEALGVARLFTALTEEWFRQAIAWWHQARGRMVIFDRHFSCDHQATALAAPTGGRPWTERLHGFVLDRLYPRPDLVICLDGPVETLYGRKPDGSLERRAELRDAYRRLAEVVPRFALVDTNRPEDEVVEAVRAIVERARTEGESGGSAVDRAAERLAR
jgi:thymidylate kinase